MKSYARNKAILRLQMWGEFYSKSSNLGWASKGAISDMMEYGVRVSSGNVDILPVWAIQKYEMATHRFLVSLYEFCPLTFELAYYEFAWHFEHPPGEAKSRRKLRTGAILDKMGIKRRKYQELKNNLFYALLGHFEGDI